MDRWHMDWETNSSAGNSIQKQNYKHTKLTDVGYYDTLKMSGLSEKSRRF